MMSTPELFLNPGIDALVSVILPTYNQAQTLPRALHSALSQTGVDFEIICVNDASTDDTPQVLQAFRHPYLRCLHHTTHRGASAARNAGLRASRGAWLAFLDSDDEWLPGLLVAQRQQFLDSSLEVGVVFTSFERVQRNLRYQVPGRLQVALSHLPHLKHHLSGNLNQALQRGNFITLQSAMIRRVCLEQVGGFDEALMRLQDWDLWLRLAPHFHFSWIKQPMVRVYPSGNSISSTADTLPEALRIILDKQRPTSLELLAHVHFILGDFHMQRGEIHQGVAELQLALRNSPSTLTYWLACVTAAINPSLYRTLASRFRYTPEGL